MEKDYIKKYHESLHLLENYLDFACDVSDATAERKNIPWRKVRAHQMYNRLTLTCTSLIWLLPKSRMFPSPCPFWDFFAVASLARNIGEIYQMFYYTGVEEVPEEEASFRLLLLTYHLNNEKYKLYREASAPEDVLKDFEEEIPKEAEALSKHPFFSTLDRKKQKDILKGNMAKYLSDFELLNRLPFEVPEYKPLFRLYSNQVHATPLSFYSQSNERGRGKENQTEVEYITMAIDFVTKYLVAAILNLIELFPDCEAVLHPVKLKVVKKHFKQYTA